MATKLSIYNGAAALLGETPLASLSEDRSVRYWLDRAWDDGVIDYCLEQGQWFWATRTLQMTYSTSIVPAFGFRYAFEIPDDFKMLNSLWVDAFCQNPLDSYFIEAGVIYCESDTIYLKYISNDTNYGGNLARYPKAYEEFVQAKLADLAQANITNSESVQNKIDRALAKSLTTAKNIDKRAKPKDVLPLSNWTKARIGSGIGPFGNNQISGF